VTTRQATKLLKKFEVCGGTALREGWSLARPGHRSSSAVGLAFALEAIAVILFSSIYDIAVVYELLRARMTRS
jgi:hypothetical protein